MRRVAIAAGLAVLLSACETFEETYTVDQDVMVNEQGVQVNADLEEDFWGARWYQFRAYNSNDFSVCVRVTLKDGSYTSGHSLGGAHLVGPGGSADVGYITTPADFYVNTAVFNPNADGACY